MDNARPPLDKSSEKISEHFLRLHVLLQRIEAELLHKHRSQEEAFEKTARCISEQLRRTEEQLETALLLTAIANQNLDRVNISEVTERLKKLLTVPCDLVRNPSWDEELLRFQADENIQENIMNHCKLETPPTDEFLQLVSKEQQPQETRFPPPGVLAILPELPKRKSSVPWISKTNPKWTKKETKGKTKGLVEGSSEMVRVTHIKDPSCFYVQQIFYQENLRELEEELNGIDGAEVLDAEDNVINKLCIVKSEGKWLRCRVINQEGNKYDVLHIDYGSENKVALSSLRKMHPRFTYLPATALRCALDNIVPSDGNWSPSATTYFRNLLSDETVPVSMHTLTINGDTYLVDLCLVPRRNLRLISVRETMVLAGFATYVSTQRLLRMNPDSTQTFFFEELPMERFTRVRVTHVESPDAIYVQKIEDTQLHLQQLETNLTNYYNENPTACEIIHGVEEGLPCAVLFQNTRWYRAVVCEQPDINGMATVFFIDYGQRATVPCDQIRMLPKRYLNSRAQAIRISLRHVAPLPGSDWSLEAGKFVNRCLQQQLSFRVIPFERTENVYSSCVYLDSNKNVALLLKQAGLAKYTKPRIFKNGTKQNTSSTKIVPPEQNPEDPVDQKEQTDSTEKDSNDSEDPFKVCVLVYEAKSPDCIYVGDANCRSSTTKFLEEMQHFYTKFRAKEPRDWSPDAICVVHLDSTFHRARVLEAKNSDMFLVLLVDLGREEIVHRDEMQPLHARFARVSSFVFRIKLAGMLPCGGGDKWPSASCEALRRIIEESRNCKFFISKVEDVEEEVIPVELWIKQFKIDGPLEPTRIEINSVNRMLVDLGLALPIKGYTEKRDKILAVELKRQLKQRYYTLLMTEMSEASKDDLQDDDEPCSDLVQTRTFSEISSDTEDEERIEDWKPVEDIPEDNFVAIVTYLSEDVLLCLHPKRNSETLKQIEEELQEWHGSSSDRLDVIWTAGEPCIAQYHGNMKWYRGRIVEVVEWNLIKVEFVDYGNVEECSLKMLRRKLIFEHVPVQCTKCVIQGLEWTSRTWALKELDLIHRLLVDSECQITVLQRTGERLIVSVCLLDNATGKQRQLVECLKNDYGMKISSPLLETEDATSSRDSPDVVVEGYLETELSTSVSEELAVDSLASDEPQDDDKELAEVLSNIGDVSWDTSKVDADSLPDSRESQFPEYKPLMIPEDLDFVEIKLCCNITATKFYAHILENEHSKELREYYKQYEKLMQDIQKDVLEQPLLKDFSPGTACCAQFVDQIWYRCIITECNAITDTCKMDIKLFYMDFGNSEIRQINTNQVNELYKPPAEWLELPMASLKCQLHSIQLLQEEKQTEALQHLWSLYEEHRLFARIRDRIDGTLSVDLFHDAAEGESVNARLIQAGVFKAGEPKQKSD